ncbi:MAG: hypothetical protein FWG38_03435, partial [Defluviitaleaceae bacterium]|nr:hypothetical protein [Defluviitaleaceae bacterium]
GMSGGGDMLGLLKKYPGRGVTVHLKPFTEGKKDVFFSDPDGAIDWAEYFDVCRKEAGTRWYIIEYMNNDRFPGDPVAGIAAAAQWFREWESKVQ